MIILSVVERFVRFDLCGYCWITGGFEGFDVFGGFGDIFDAFFGSGPRTRTRAQPGRDLQVSMTIAFEEAVFGTTKEIVTGSSRVGISALGPGRNDEKA